jgi:hypothetical protein
MIRRVHAPTALAIVLAVFTFGLSLRGIVLCVATDHTTLEFFGNTCCDATAHGEAPAEPQLASACCSDTALSIGERNVDSQRRAAPESAPLISTVPIVFSANASQCLAAVVAGRNVSPNHLRTVILRV